MKVLPPSTWLLRLLMLAGPPLALEAGTLAGHHVAIQALLLVVLLSALSALSPAGWFGTGAAVFVLVWWVQAVRADLPLAVLPAALALTTAHVAATLADLGPPRMTLAGDVARLWARRGAASVLVAGLLWVVARAVAGTSTPGLWVVALATGTIAAAVAAAVLALANRTDEVRATSAPRRPRS